MFVIVFKSGSMLQCSDGTVYKYATTKEAASMVDICYGYSYFKRGLIKIKRFNPIS